MLGFQKLLSRYKRPGVGRTGPNLCREGWASGKRLGFPSELTGLLYTKLLWLDTGMETGISKLGGGTACRSKKNKHG